MTKPIIFIPDSVRKELNFFLWAQVPDLDSEQASILISTISEGEWFIVYDWDDEMFYCKRQNHRLEQIDCNRPQTLIEKEVTKHTLDYIIESWDCLDLGLYGISSSQINQERYSPLEITELSAKENSND